MKIGENIQLHREQHGMSQQELADKLGVTRQSISKWENDTAKHLCKIIVYDLTTVCI